MSLVVYGGPTHKGDLSSEFHVRDDERTMHVLIEGRVTPVPDELGKALLADAKQREDRFKGHKFRSPTKEEREAFEGALEADINATGPDPDTGGPGGTSSASGGGTATAASRT